MPSNGAVRLCSIFIASRVSSFWPLVTASPCAASTAITRPGIGERMAPSSAWPPPADAAGARQGEGEGLAVGEDQDGAALGGRDAFQRHLAAGLDRAGRAGVAEADPRRCRRIGAEAVQGRPRIALLGVGRNRRRASPSRQGSTPRPDGAGSGTSSSSLAGMKPVSTSPARKPASSAARARKAALVLTGQTSTASSAPTSSSIAHCRLGPWAISLAIIGSYQGLIRSPSSTPVSIAQRARQHEMVEPPGRGQELVRRILGIEPRLDAHGRGSRARPGASAASRRRRRAAAIRPGPAPVISSVTGCSTWSRVFISMNQMRSARRPVGGVGDELDRARADIVDRAAPP